MIGKPLLPLLLVIVLAGCAAAGERPAFDPTLPTAVPTPTPTANPAPLPTPTPTPTPTPEPIAVRSMPTTAGDLTAALTEAEEAIRDPAVDDATATEWGRRQQRLYSVLAENPDWEADVLAGLSDEVRFGVQQTLAARRSLTSLVKSETLAETLPAWRLREPLPAAELIGYYREAEAQTGIPWHYLAAINFVETRMGRIEGLSTASATGPMQFLPSTWAECCEGDPTVDRDAIIGAGVYLNRSGGPEDMQTALYRYNNSDSYVDGVTAYAEVIADNELAYRGYHAWRVYFLSAAGLILMPSDYYEPEPVPAEEWLADHPDALVAPPEDS